MGVAPTSVGLEKFRCREARARAPINRLAHDVEPFAAFHETIYNLDFTEKHPAMDKRDISDLVGCSSFYHCC